MGPVGAISLEIEIDVNWIVAILLLPAILNHPGVNCNRTRNRAARAIEPTRKRIRESRSECRREL
jgi:hypothetical protein